MRRQTVDEITDHVKRVEIDMTTILQIAAHAKVRPWVWGGAGSVILAVCVHIVTLGAPWEDLQRTLNLHPGYVQARRRRGGSRHSVDDCDTGEAEGDRLQHVQHVENVD
jgi:hypothetical protein